MQNASARLFNSTALQYYINVFFAISLSELFTFRFGENVKILHFIGQLKPWVINFDPVSKKPNAPQEYNHLTDYLDLWWNLFCSDVHPKLVTDMVSDEPFFLSFVCSIWSFAVNQACCFQSWLFPTQKMEITAFSFCSILLGSVLISWLLNFLFLLFFSFNTNLTIPKCEYKIDTLKLIIKILLTNSIY